MKKTLIDRPDCEVRKMPRKGGRDGYGIVVRLSSEEDSESIGRHVLCNAEGNLSKPEATRIVTALNSHNDLVNALIRCKDYLYTKYPKESNIFNEIEAAIAKANNSK